MEPLISCDELADRLDKVRVCDVRWSLTDPSLGHDTYLDGHVPGAVFVDLDRDLSAPPGRAGRHPLPNILTWAETLSRLGITPNDEVVVYDDMGGAVASRMWWMLRAIGHVSSRLLDGGYEAWRREDHVVEKGEVLPPPATYPPPEGFSGVATREELADRQVIDVRAPERYRGDTEPVDPKAGHIPGALNIPIAQNLTTEHFFQSPKDLAAIYSTLSRPVLSCGSGVNACHSAVAMVIAGHPMPDIYIGSFSEWSRLDLPVATGDRP